MDPVTILRGQIAALDAERDALKAELAGMATSADNEQRTALTVDENTRVDQIAERAAAIPAERSALVDKLTKLELLDAERAAAPKGPQFIRKPEPVQPSDIRSLAPMEVRDASMRIVETSHLAPERQAGVQALIETRTERCDGTSIGRRLLATENPSYRSAWMKAMRYGANAGWTADEARAVDEFRALSIGVDTAGGFGIPVLIDPTIIITTGTTASPLIAAMRVETITNDVWRGVSAAGTAWSFDAEAAAVSDDASTFAQPTVQAHMARGYIPYSIEFGMDYPSVAAELGRLLEVGYDDLLASKLMTGSGTNEPWGIFTALDANTNAEVGA